MKLVRIVEPRKKHIYINNVEGFLDRALNIEGELCVDFGGNLARNNG